MKKTLMLPVFVVGALLLGGCSYGANYGGVSTTPSASPVPVSQSPVSSAVTDNAVTIQNFAFSPATLTVKAGTTVIWTNKDSVTHTISSATFNSGSLNKGDSFQFTFSEKGTFKYSCGIHPNMQATIVVQ